MTRNFGVVNRQERIKENICMTLDAANYNFESQLLQHLTESTAVMGQSHSHGGIGYRVSLLNVTSRKTRDVIEGVYA